MTRDEIKLSREKVWPLALQFAREHQTFRSRDLDEHIEALVGECAPGTAQRRLQELREKGYLNYYTDSDHIFHITSVEADPQLDFDFDANAPLEVA